MAVSDVQAPTVADAKVAADALVAAGVEEVLLFGSVASGEAGAGSDIDLVAVFADLDYAHRWEITRRLEDTARAAVGAWPVQVFVTDRPEWRNRVEKVSGSFESAISGDAVRVAEAGTRGRVRWDKEMVLPMSNPDEALKQFSDRALNELSRVIRAVALSPDELDVSAPRAVRETERLLRMVDVCTHSALAVEVALKSLAVLRKVPTPTDRALRDTGHSIPECLRLLPESIRGSVEELVTRRGVTPKELSEWRIASTYPENADSILRLADQRVDAYASTALDVCGFTVNDIRTVVGDTTLVQAAEDEWRRAARYLGGRDIRTGRPRSTPGASDRGVGL